MVSQAVKIGLKKYWTNRFEQILKPIIEENPNLKACRSEPLRGNILTQIITNLINNPIIVDLFIC